MQAVIKQVGHIENHYLLSCSGARFLTPQEDNCFMKISKENQDEEKAENGGVEGQKVCKEEKITANSS